MEQKEKSSWVTVNLAAKGETQRAAICLCY